MPFSFDLNRAMRGLEYSDLFRESGRVKRVLGPMVEGTLPGSSVGGLCRILGTGANGIEAEIVGFKDRSALLMPLDSTEGIQMGARIEHESRSGTVKIGKWMIGHYIDGRGHPVPGFGPKIHEHEIAEFSESRPLRVNPLGPLERESIKDRLQIGVRAFDSCIPLGKGQRIAIMAASGVGKSMLMGMIARNSGADVNVIALIGERGREVTEFLERDLGPEGLKKSVVIGVTGDESPILRIRGALLATAVAEYFRDQGLNCMLLMDSVTRYAMALREIGLAAGEPPTTKGYTPSVFAQLPKLLERAGSKKNSGSITGIYTVLVEGNDMDDPIADHVRATVDGHVVLSRELAAKNHYPAIDVLQSVSRLSSSILKGRSMDLNSEIRKNLATYKEAEDLLNIGGYRKGNNPDWDRAISLYPKLTAFLKQSPGEMSENAKSEEQLEEIFRG